PPSGAVHHRPAGPLAGRFASVGLEAGTIREAGMWIGTGSAGQGLEATQIDLLCGAKSSPLGEAWAYQLTYPRHGYEALTTILEPNLTVRPSTLILPVNELGDLRQANMIYGPTQNAVAQAIVDRLARDVIPEPLMHTHVMIVQAAVHPQALDRRVLHHNAYEATCAAIDDAFGGM
ncbi:MAG: formaldehyde-activating enzyme, partial [Chloroflexi bacterium]|nr:formaldehyde-activating enzyme [Chloroflexota bacterium]